jgi:acyl-CoA synthetase (AMP-forming)/AMP-acid ligase II
VRILVERHAPEDLAALDEAWRTAETFALVPEKAGVSEEWLRAALASLPSDLRQHHFALLTSGSTGRPKLVVGARARAEALAGTLHDVQQSEEVGETILALPLSYCYAFVNQWLWGRLFARTLVQTRGVARLDMLRAALRDARSAMFCLVGSQAPLLLGYFGEEVFDGVVRLHFAGGAFPQNDLDRLQRMFPAASIFNNYGCAEAMPRLTVRPAFDGRDPRDVGPPVPGVALRTSGGGAVEFRSDYAAVAFFDGEFHRVGADDWLESGDLGSIDERGRLHLEGRAHEVFKRYGEKIALPALLESIHCGWSGDAAFYRERDANGEEAHVLVLAPRAADAAVRAILAVFRSSHPRPHWPLRIESAEALPLLANGKVDVGRLRHLPERTVHWRQRF